MSASELSALAGVLLSLAFSYLPGISDGYDKLPSTHKRLVMAVLLLVVSIGAYGLSCANVINNVSCTQPGAIALVDAFIAALVANQAMFLLSPQPQK